MSTDSATDPVIVATARSPIGRAFKGSLTEMRPDDMSAQIVTKLLEKVPELPKEEIEDLIMGTGSPGGEQGFNIGRATAVLAGLGDVPGTTVNRYCSSSLQTIRMAAHAIKAGEGDAFIAAGVECVSRYAKGNSDSLPDTANPIFKGPGARSKVRSEGGHGVWTPAEGLADLYISMGETAENVAELKGVSREAMDEYGVMSQHKAEAAINRGFFELDITPIQLADGTVISKDDGPRAGVTLEAVSQMKPAFRPDGRVTAANACPLNDGAAGVVVMSRKRAEELGITPLARIISSSVSALNPEIMGLGPIEAIKKALARAGMTIKDIDLVEINEAFAAQVIPSADELGIDMVNQLNVNGGAIALGHPFGQTGARIMTTLINGLTDSDKTFGLESMCGGVCGVWMR
jgi:acetyl-CoA C-acetyltransferase